jgi:hypothetical protein
MKGMEAGEAAQIAGLAQESAKIPIPALKTQRAAEDLNAHELQPAGAPKRLPGKAKTSRKSRAKREAYTLTQADTEVLKTLKQRCEAVGIKVGKRQLLTAGLHLLASMSVGKFLAVIGPMEARSSLARIMKKKSARRLGAHAGDSA